MNKEWVFFYENFTNKTVFFYINYFYLWFKIFGSSSNKDKLIEYYQKKFSMISCPKFSIHQSFWATNGLIQVKDL